MPWQQHTLGDCFLLGNQAEISSQLYSRLQPITLQQAEKTKRVLFTLKASNSTRFFVVAIEKNLGPPGGFIATVSLSVPHVCEGLLSEEYGH